MNYLNCSITTVIELINDSAARLEQAGVAYGHGTANAFDEAAWLVLWKLGHPLDRIDEHADEVVTPQQQAGVEALVAQRIATRKPAAYLTQEAWLQGVPFYIDERAIVPRSFIAEIIANGDIDYWLGEHTRVVLDLCTGNGSLAVLAALCWPDVSVAAADISPAALEVARINIDRHALAARISLIHSDGLKGVLGSFDLILCNPPYVNTRSMGELPAEYLAEPALALAGGEDGMDFIRRVLADAPPHMSDHAVLVLEIGNERAGFEAAFPRLAAVWLETSAGDDQVLLLTRDVLLAGGAPVHQPSGSGPRPE